MRVALVGGRASSVAFRPINVTQLNVAKSTSIAVQLLAYDAYSNPATGYSGSFTVTSSSTSTTINGAAAPVIVALTSSIATFTFTDSTAAVVVLSLIDSSGTGLNVSSTQPIYVVASTCAAGTVSSGVLDWTGDSCGTLHNSGNWLVNLGLNSFSRHCLGVHHQRDAGQRVHWLSMQPARPGLLRVRATIFDTIVRRRGAAAVPETGVPGSSMTFEMSYESSRQPRAAGRSTTSST